MHHCEKCKSRMYAMAKLWKWPGIKICHKCGLMWRAQGVQQLKQIGG